MVVEEQGRTYWCRDCRHIFRLRSTFGICPRCCSPHIEFFDGVQEIHRERPPSGFMDYLASIIDPRSSDPSHHDRYIENVLLRFPDSLGAAVDWLFGPSRDSYEEPCLSCEDTRAPGDDFFLNTGLTIEELMAIYDADDPTPSSSSSHAPTSASSSSRAPAPASSSRRAPAPASSSRRAPTPASSSRRATATSSSQLSTRRRTGNRSSPSPNCTICLQALDAVGSETQALWCGHCFHEDCLSPWLAQNNTCPICRREV